MTSATTPKLGPLGLEPPAAQYVVVNAGYAAWVIPGTAGLCVVTAEPLPGKLGSAYHISCATLAQAAAGDLTSFTVDDVGDVTSVHGVAPNNDNHVTLDYADGHTISVPVVDNLYDYVIGGGEPQPTAVSVAGTSGAVTSTALGR
jgi:hypothetical protein